MRENAVKLLRTWNWREKAWHRSGWGRKSGETMKMKGAEEQSAAENEENLQDLLFKAVYATYVYVYVFVQVSPVGWSIVPYLLDKGVGV